jgi:hypothetical protein
VRVLFGKFNLIEKMAFGEISMGLWVNSEKFK